MNLEAVARGLGFTYQATNSGNEVVRWNRIKEYLISFGVATSGDGRLPEYIPENIFYRLAMKAKNAVAEKFQALVADEIIPQIRKTGSYSAQPTNAITIDPNVLAMWRVSLLVIPARQRKGAALAANPD